MRCGCIATSKMECDSCHRFLGYGERYLIIDDEKGEKKRFCVDCCLAQGFASYTVEKGKETITFFPQK